MTRPDIIFSTEQQEAIDRHIAEIKALVPEKQRVAYMQRILDRLEIKMQDYAGLDAPVIETVRKATVSAGLVLTFRDPDDGVEKVVIVQAGEHYRGLNKNFPADRTEPLYMLPGGFLNLLRTPGTTQVKPNDRKAEDFRIGAVREGEEELVDDTGKPILSIDPARLRPRDLKVLTLESGERRVVSGFQVELNPDEVSAIKVYAEKMKDEAYRLASIEHTVNDETGKPEIFTAKIVPLKDITMGHQYELMYPDQNGLFRAVEEHIDHIESLKRKALTRAGGWGIGNGHS